MNGRLEIRVDTLSVFGLADEPEAKAAEDAIERGLRRLAERLAGSPFERTAWREMAIESLSLSNLPADELLSERGAERFADELYSALMARLR
jgi:hypothetical protein